MPTAYHHYCEGAYLLHYDESGLSPLGDARSNYPRLPHIRHIGKDDLSCCKPHNVQTSLDQIRDPLCVSIQSMYFKRALSVGHFEESQPIHRLLFPKIALAAVNKPFSDLEKQSFLFAGLGSEYTPFVTSVTTRADTLSIEEICGHLLAHELCLEHTQPVIDVFDVAMHLASQNPPHCGGFLQSGQLKVHV